jgi:hypothetical protein
MRPFLAALVLCCLALPCPVVAFEFMLSPSGDRLTLPSREVTFRLPARLPEGLSQQEVQAAVEAALGVWSKGSGLTLRWEPGDPAAVPGYRTASGHHNDIFFVEDWNRDAGAIAQTVLSVDLVSNQIRDADILFNLAEYEFRALAPGHSAGGPYCDFQEVLTHEIGHALGLSHSQVPEAVMYGQGLRGDTSKRALADDDVQGVQALYAAATDEADGGVGCSSASGAPGLAGLAGLLALALRRGGSARRRA